MTHLGKAEIEAFLAGRASQEDRDHLRKHLLTRCDWCLRLFKNMAVPLLEDEPWAYVEEVPEEAYDAPLARAATRARQFATRWRKESKRLAQAQSRENPQVEAKQEGSILLAVAPANTASNAQRAVA